MDPDEPAHHNAQGRDEKWKLHSLAGTKSVVHQRGRVYADECDKCPKVQQLRPFLIREQKGAEQCDRTCDEDIVARYMMPPVDCAEHCARKRVVPPHAVHQSRGAELSCERRTEVCNQ